MTLSNSSSSNSSFDLNFGMMPKIFSTTSRMETLRSILAAFRSFSKIEIFFGFIENLMLNMADYMLPISEFHILLNDVIHHNAVFKLFEQHAVNLHPFVTDLLFV